MKTFIHLREDLNTGDFSSVISQSPYKNGGMQNNSIARRNYPKIFDVSTNSYMKARRRKPYFDSYDDYFDEPEIKDYAKKNPKEPIILRHPQSGEMVFFRKGSKTLQTLRNYRKRYK